MGTRIKKERKWRRSPEVPNSGKISRLNQNFVVPIYQKKCKFRKIRNTQISVKNKGFGQKFRPIYLLII